jgi:hypothetical protein
MWLGGKKHGHGQLTGPDGYFYDGGWQHDKRHGLGKEVDPQTSSSYEGLFDNDKKNGTASRNCARKMVNLQTRTPIKDQRKLDGVFENDTFVESATPE